MFLNQHRVNRRAVLGIELKTTLAVKMATACLYGWAYMLPGADAFTMSKLIIGWLKTHYLGDTIKTLTFSISASLPDYLLEGVSLVWVACHRATHTKADLPAWQAFHSWEPPFDKQIQQEYNTCIAPCLSCMPENFWMIETTESAKTKPSNSSWRLSQRNNHVASAALG